MTAHHSINPSTQILDANGYDWAWAFVWFKDIPGYPGYFAGSDGTIWSRLRFGPQVGRTGSYRRRKLCTDRDGYQVVTLHTRDGMRKRRVHRLVLEAFVGPCPEGMECCHAPDPDPGNNRLDNIRWDTKEANIQDARLLGRLSRQCGEHIASSKLKDQYIPEIRRLAASGVSHGALASRYGVAKSRISDAVHRKTWRHVK